ncbi:MAG: tetratricopeptide repeat protein, partial [Anaerolineales bacterium]|nr:tetratricopeptide repeat protein [Anaerolineales bacterium]
MINKIVISYSDDDRDIALKVRAQLKSKGYDVWIAHEDLKGVFVWTQSILDAIDHCDGLVLIWSQDANRSEHVREEIRLARVFLKPIFPFHARPLERVPPLPPEIEEQNVIRSGDFDSKMNRLMKQLSDSETVNHQFMEHAEHGFIPKARNPFFVNRKRELKDLFIDSRGYLGKTKKNIPIAISGLAGIGKSELALAFAYRFNFFFPDGVYWVDTPNSIIHEYGKIGPHLKLEKLRDERPFDYADRVYEKLNQLSEGLVIFDNVPDDDLSEFQQWCPHGNRSCSVILTTRRSPRGFPIRLVNLTELDEDSAYELLLSRRMDREEINRSEEQRQALREICRITGNYPFTLNMCASNLQSEFIKPTDYIKSLQKGFSAQLSGKTKKPASAFIADPKLWALLDSTYANLNRELADPYFLLMCCFATHGIDEGLITQAYGDPDGAKQALDELANYSFIRQEQNKAISVHPLVAQFGRSLHADTAVDYPAKFAEVVIGFLREHEDDLARDEVRREKPHITEALRVTAQKGLWDSCAQLHTYNADIEAGIQEQIDSLKQAYQIIEQHLPEQLRKLPGLSLRLGKAYRSLGQLNEALTAFGNADALYRTVGEVDSGETAALSYEFGDTYLALGRFAEAYKILTDALEMASATFDHTAPEVLQLQQALARRELLLGNYDVAEKSFQDILKYRNQFYNTHPNTLSAAGLVSAHADLSRLALERGHYADAIQSVEEALAITKDFHGEHQPEYNHLSLLLGTIYYHAGKYRTAEEQLGKVRQDLKHIFGERHPSYARTLIVLSDVYRKQAKFDLAAAEVEIAISILDQLYGKNHPYVAEALEVQGKIYDHRGDFDQEELVWKQILEIQSHFYPKQHPALATTYQNYANMHERKGEYAQALALLNKSLEITEQSLGNKHTNYYGRLVLKAACLYKQQAYGAAQLVLDEAKGLQEAIFGTSAHPY